MNIRKHLRTCEKLYVLSRDNLTGTGRAVLCLGIFCIFGIGALDSPLFILSCVLMSFLVLTAVVAYLFRPHLDIRVVPPELAKCGQPTRLSILVSNRKKYAAYDLKIELAKTKHLHRDTNVTLESLAPGETRRIYLSFRPRQRGSFPIPALLSWTTFPLNLVRLSRKHQPKGELIVVPNYNELDGLELIQRNAPQSGDTLTEISVSTGNSGDYFGSRDYVPGMFVRRWDNASWARLGRPIAREFLDFQLPPATIAIDTTFPAAVALDNNNEPEPALETSLTCAASVACALDKTGHQIDSIVTSRQIHNLKSSQGGESRFHLSLRALAEVQPATNSKLDQQLRQLGQQTRHGLVFVIHYGEASHLSPVIEHLQAIGQQVALINATHHHAEAAQRRVLLQRPIQKHSKQQHEQRIHRPHRQPQPKSENAR